MRKVAILAVLGISFLLTTSALGQCYKYEADKFVPEDGADGDWYGGTSVAIDANVAVIGATHNDESGTDAGAAYVYRFDGDSWIFEAKLLASDGAAYDWFGWSVCVDGDIIVVGATNDKEAGDWTGAAYVFRYDGLNWVEEKKLLADGMGHYWQEFGYSAAVDSTVIVIGANKAGYNGFKSGAVYVYRYDSSNWVQEDRVLASDGAELATFGNSVAVEGEKILVGAPGKNAQGLSPGSAYVFDFNGLGWTEETILSPADASHGDHFGYSVSLFGNAALISAFGDDGADPNNIYCNSGSAYVFRFNGANWIEEAKLEQPAPKCHDHFAASVELSGDLAVIGEPRGMWQTSLGTGNGYAYCFDGSNWRLTSIFEVSDGEYGDHFGWKVAVSGDVVLVAADLDTHGGISSGSAFVFDNVICGSGQDCNGNVVSDDCDIDLGFSLDCNFNGVPDECEPDDDSDGVTNDCDSCSATFSGINVGPDGCPLGDFDKDGDVDGLDFAIFASNWLIGT